MIGVWHLWQQKCKNSCSACVRVRARGSDYRYFYTSKNSVFDGWFVDCFLPPNIHWKQAVVFHKTTRCFHQNDTLFFIKRYVVFIKTSRRLKCNNALCWLPRLTLRCCKRSNDRLGIILPQKKGRHKKKMAVSEWICDTVIGMVEMWKEGKRMLGEKRYPIVEMKSYRWERWKDFVID